MTSFFVPFVADQPSIVEVNGHRLLLVASTREDLEEELQTLGAEEVREFEARDLETSELAEMARDNGGGIVLAPPGITMLDLVRNLEAQLPWLQ